MAAGRGGFDRSSASPSDRSFFSQSRTAAPAGASHGPNIRGANQPYMGPRTPAGPKHRYHLQVFALDTTLPADAGASLDSLTAAMKDHVLASGEIIGLGQVDPNAPPPARRGAPPAGATTPPPGQ